MYSFHELADIVQNEIKNLKYPQQPELLYAPIVYSLEEGGKRIRPVALLMACNLFRDEIDCAKPAALAVEVFHNFTLLHDDIMDRSDTRRGKPAVHTRWNDNVAILSGDAMMIYAYKLLCGCDRRVLPQLLETFNETAIGVCEGQQYDMDFESRDDVTVDRYLEMIRLKTGVLLAGALKLGAICAEAQPWQAELLYNFGINVGLAFQLQDDLFDTYGDAAVFGKPIGGDILAGKKNVPADYGAENRRCGHPRRTARAAARRRHVGGGENRNRARHLRPAGSPEDHRKGDRRLFPQCRPNPQQPGSRDRTHRPAAGTERNPVEPQKITGLSKKRGQRAPTAKRWKR